jgi:hypothetical protein
MQAQTQRAHIHHAAQPIASPFSFALIAASHYSIDSHRLTSSFQYFLTFITAFATFPFCSLVFPALAYL